MNRHCKSLLSALVLAICSVCSVSQPAFGQAANTAPRVQSRVVSAVDENRLVVLRGNVHPMARPEYDKGLVEAGRPMERMILVLQRSPEQDQALAAFNQRQYDPKSPDYHRWLHADEFGQLYGPSDYDIAAVTSWLQNRGFQIYDVSKGRVSIQFSGTAAQVQDAFHVEMHKYLVKGVEHIANDRDPQIPEALAPVITGIASLHDFFAKPQTVFGKYVKRDRATGKITVVDSQLPPNAAPQSVFTGENGKSLIAAAHNSGGKAQLTYVDGSGDTREDLTPYDFATIYNILPTWNAGTTGKGVTIAISAVSDIAISDFNTFRSSFGLPASTLNVIHNGTDPGADGGGGQGENTLDVEMAGATAPGAQIDLVVSKDTATTGGDVLSDEDIIDNEIAPIMSGSYGECELGLGNSGNAMYNSIWQQGATEGISIFESSGDQGSAGCSNSDERGPNADEVGLQVNGVASSPYLTAVGGTDFTWSFINKPISTYWNTSNGTNLVTAKGILPEVPWNSTCTNPLLVPLFGVSNSEQLCNEALGDSSFDGLVVITGGSGGKSHCTTSSGGTISSCSGGYAKPSWQAGPGVPADGKRDLPDVSLFASAGFPDGINGSAILFCEASSGSPEKTCDYSNPDYIIYQEIGGTSASSPLMAGVMALVLEGTKTTSQGLANPVFYQLAQNQATKGTACNSSTVANVNQCVFYDISQGTNAQVCITGDTDCVTNTSGDEVGILSGYAATTGYDQAIGLGSVNVTNLVNMWPASTKPAPAVSLSPTSFTFANTRVGTTSGYEPITLKNTGNASLSVSSITSTGTNASSFSIPSSHQTCGTVAAGASCTFDIAFSPTTAGTFNASIHIADNASGSPQSLAVSGTGFTTAAPVVSLSPTSFTFANTRVGTTSGYEPITLKNTGNASLSVSSITSTGTNASSFSIPSGHQTCGTVAAGASCTFDIAFSPTTAGTFNASIHIADNASGSPQSLAVSGAGFTTAAPAVSLSPTSFTFANTRVGTTSGYEVITLKNTGNASLKVSSITSTGTNASSFSIPSSHQACGTVAAGASCTFDIAFSPTATGTFTASIHVNDNASGSPQSLAVTGTGFTTAAPVVSLSPTSFTFAKTRVGTTSSYKVITLSNTGNASLTVSSITSTGTNASSFSIPSSHQTCGTVAAGASCTFDIAFSPTATGTFTASIHVNDNATGSPQSVAVSGTGE